MIKNYLLRIILVFAIICRFCNQASAQYAIGGTAGPNLYNSVYWLTWDPTAPGTTIISAPAGADASHVLNGTYVYQFSPTVRITAIISNEVFVGGASPDMLAYTPGNYAGDGLDLIYSGNNVPKIFGSRGVANSGLSTAYGGQVTFDIDVKVAILINGVYTDVVYPGMVVGDAESVDAGGEYISGETPNPIAWQLINKRTEGNSADDHYKMDLSNGGRAFKIYADLPPGNFGVQAVMFAHGARSIKNVSMKGSGITAIALGFILPFDLGDEPSTYGVAGHYMDQFQITDYYPGDGTYAVVNYNTTPLLAFTNVYIGTNNVDPDGQPVGTTLANNDDLVGNNDESTLTPATLPDVKVNQAGNIVFNIPVTNNKSVPATLYAWIDFNNDGVFSADEVLSVTVPANTSNQTFTLTFLNSTFASKLKVGTLYCRLRISTTPLTDNPATPNVDERSFSFAADGEAEDYKLNDILGVTISGTIINDHDGAANGITGSPVQLVSGQQLYAYLVDNTGTIINKATVTATGTYAFANTNNGSYTVAISTNNVAIGGTLASVAANLPANWKPAGEVYGLNNAGHTGVEPGVPNLQIAVATPGTSLDITGVDFALNQVPVTNPDLGFTNNSTPVTIDPLANDLDQDGGTINPTSVLLIDPADNVKKTIVTIAGQGTFVVNTTTGRVTFTPVATFTGKSVVSYTVKDDYGSESLSSTITISTKPVGTPDAAITVINTPVTTDVKLNDGISATGTTVGAPTLVTPHGTIVINPSGTITYTPATGYVGTDTYTYTLTTADGVVSDPITVAVLINPGIIPVGFADADATNIGTPVTTTVTANDPSALPTSTIAIATQPAHGTALADATTGKVTYTPAAGFIGKDTYTYTLTNGVNTSAPITVTISVRPVGVTDNDITTIGAPVTTTVKANDGISATGTTVAIGTNPAHGTVLVNATGTITFTPTAGYIGKDTYTYTLTTADGVVSAPVTVNISIKPVGINDTDTTPINTAVTTTVKANDGASATGTTVAIATTPAHGIVAVNAAGTITFTPTTNYIGKDTYTYTLTTADGVVSDPITVTVNIRPVGVNDIDATFVNTPVTTNVKTNDGASATGTTVTAGTAPLHGAILVNASGTITYTPTTGYTGTDTYTYILTTADGVASTPITVTITINTKPIGVNDTDTTPINTIVSTNVTANDPSGAGALISVLTQPAHGSAAFVSPLLGVINYTPAVNYIGKDTYTYTLTVAGVVSDPITVTINIRPVGVNDADVTAINTPVTTTVKANDGASATGTTVTAGTLPLHGAIVVNASGTITYTPTTGYTGTDTYTYILTTADGVASAPVTVNITVNSKPVGVNDVDITPINTAVTTNVKTNDPGAAGSTIAILAQPAHGTAAVVNATTGTVIYTPVTGYIGKDTYTYTLTNAGIVSDPITVTISIRPVGVNDVDVTAINTPVTTIVKTNDGASATGTTVSAGTLPLHGAIVVNALGTITYTPVTGYVGTDTYTYTLTTADGVASAPITVTITINNKPIGVNDVDVTPINTPVTTTVVTNDPGAPGSTVAVLTQPGHGTAVLLSANNGTITYTPATGFIGKDTYTYTLTNGGIVSDPITVTISVRPVGTDDVDRTPVNTPVTTIVKTNDGASAAGTTVAAATLPAHGSIVVNASGSITYTPVTGYVGTDTYTYTLTTADGVISAPITVTITIYTASMSLTKVATNGGTKAGDVINYTLVVTNTGNTVLTNVVVADAGADAGSITPANIATLAVGASATVTAKHTLIQAEVNATKYSNQASVSATDVKGLTVVKPKSDDPATPAIDDPTVITILPLGTMALTKTGVLLSNVVTYTFIIKNTGNVNLFSVTLSDAKLGLSNISVPVASFGLLPGETVAYNYVYTITNADRDLGTVTNTATANAKDPGANTITATASVVTTVPKSPTAVNDAARVTVNTPVVISILKNDNNGGTISLNPGTIEIITQPAHGTVVVNGDGTVTYTPAPGYAGADSFTYRVKDIFGYYTNIATVTIASVYTEKLKIPTLFTPNGDGLNDVFEIRNLGLFAQNELSIVNRWGNEVFKQTGYKNTWTGEGLNEGTYYYILKVRATDDGEWEVYKGYITLIRTFKK